MTYGIITATTKLSELAAILNGTLTRRVSLDFVRHQGSPATTRAIRGQFFSEQFTISDACHAIWIPDPRLDRAVDMTLRLHCAIIAIPSIGDQVAFDIDATYIDTTATEDVALVDATLDTGDVAAPNNSDRYVPGITVTIPNASITAAIGLVGFEIKRKSAIGTDYTGDVALIGLELEYTINR